MRSNRTKTSPATSIGAPMSPTIGSTRGTRRDRYSSEPRSTAFTAGMRLWPTRNIPSYIPTSARPVTTPSAPTPACRKVTRVRRHATPTKIAVASRTPAATNPRAAPSLCRLTTGKNAMAVPIPARATISSRIPPTRMAVSGPGPTMKLGSRAGAYSVSVGIETNVSR
jgi:hypothetical protein